MDLGHQEGNIKSGLEYLKNRGITQKEIDEFNLGYYDSNDFLWGANDTLFYMTSKFRNSIIIPIYSLYNDLVGVQCRRIKPQLKEQKFDSTVWNKRSHLYGLNKSWKYILEKNSVFVVEGVFDMIACWKYGYKNVVSSLGTNLSFEQGCLLTRFTSNVIIVFDNDKAGDIGYYKIKSFLNSLNVECYNIKLMSDPDEVLKQTPNILKNILSFGLNII